MAEETTVFPFPDPEKYGDVRTIADRAGIELQEEEGLPFHCGAKMRVKSGLMGPDYAHCNTCGLTMLNEASPHVNGGLVFNEEIMEKFGDSLWTTREGRGKETGETPG